MLTAKEFNQLIEILPRLEAFAQEHQLTSMSLVKTLDAKRAEADVYLCYTHAGDIHGLDKMAEIGRLFSQLWGLPLISDIVVAQDKQLLDESKFEEYLRPTEIYLLQTHSNGAVETATADQVADYAKRTFNIICDPSSSSENSDMSKKRKLSDEKKDAGGTVSVSTNNIFNKVYFRK